MNTVMKISDLIIPVIIVGVIVSGLCKSKNVFDIFVSGAEEGLRIMIKILPSFIGLMISVNMLKECGFIEMLSSAFGNLLNKIGVPCEVLPLVLLRPVSGSASLGVVSDILKECGADSKAGVLASVIMGSTETTFYTIALFSGVSGNTKLGKTVPAALAGNLTAVLVSVIMCSLMS